MSDIEILDPDSDQPFVDKKTGKLTSYGENLLFTMQQVIVELGGAIEVLSSEEKK